MHKLNKTNTLIGLITVVALAVAAVVVYLAYQREPDTSERMVRYSYTLHNPGSEMLHDVSFHIYLPVSDSSHYNPGETDSTHPYIIEKDSLGNRVMVIRLDKFPQLSTEVISVTTRVNIYDTAVRRHVTDKKIYLDPEKYVEIQANELVSRAAKLTKDSRQDSARQIYDWVARNIKYQGYVREDKGALHAYKSRQGDCTEYMYLFTALSRLAGIPTRNVGGFVVTEDSLLRADNFHNWAEIYLDGKWRVVDPQNRQYLENETQYIGMRIIADQPSNSRIPFNSHRFFVSNSNIQVKMN